ncbi:hypothetical protein [Aquisalibacillus elongatus]|uniref:Uncharacterized protein n=1 Tax=Aquisalibacillus elongatus TaxID=485577 RepID=A0A3N5BCW6_9BACI|nr:hypothetical protein [Aquisalibacillus elongatus]RPF55576.1 hypothetical protein EDC24_0454 [Aquisalibacillus elongatus]
MRIVFWIVVCFFVFYLGLQTATVQDESVNTAVIQNEDDLKQSSISYEENFQEKHDDVLDQETEETKSSFYQVAVVFENVVKTFFSMLFQFLYRFSAMFL